MRPLALVCGEPRCAHVRLMGVGILDNASMSKAETSQAAEREPQGGGVVVSSFLALTSEGC